MAEWCPVLRYSNHFNTADRVVELEGEGYFEVTKQNGKQFTVKTHEYDVVVKGTKFNVSAYSDDSYITTTLLEGAVELNYKKIRYDVSGRIYFLIYNRTAERKEGKCTSGNGGGRQD